MKLKKKMSIKKDKKKLESIELICQTRNTGYKTKLTTYKANHNKL